MPGLDPFDVVPPGQLSKEEVAKLGEMMAGMPGGPGSGGAGGAGDAPPAMSSEQAGLPHTPSPPRDTGTGSSPSPSPPPALSRRTDSY